jgi:hypothetical protein
MPGEPRDVSATITNPAERRRFRGFFAASVNRRAAKAK